MRNERRRKAHWSLFGPLIALAITGCTTLSPDGGFGPVASAVRERTGIEPRMVRDEAGATTSRQWVAERLQRPLSSDDAVQIALVNNAGLQALYAELGIADANLAQAGRLPNPRFTFSRISGPDTLEIDRTILFDVVNILATPLRVKLERGRLKHAQLAAAMETVKIAAETRKAYVTAVAAAETARYYEQVRLAADAGAELARRLAEAGNWSRLAQAREHVFYADAQAQLARAQHAAVAARERLVHLLGLTDDAALLKLPDRLPDPPAAPRALAAAEATALSRRLDILLARGALDSTAESLELVRATRFVGVFEAGYTNKSEANAPLAGGYEIEIAIPLFDWGDLKVAKAEAIYRQAALRLAEADGHARSEVRTAYHAYRTAYDLARHYRDEIVPLRKTIADETLLRYNGMLVSVFELLAEAREQVASVIATLEAQRDLWLADADLDFALTGGEAQASAVLAPRIDTGGSASPAGH